MTDSCRHAFTPKDFIGRIGFARSRVAAALATGCRLSSPGGEPHRGIYLCRCADDPGQAAGGCRRHTQFVYSPYFGEALQCLPGTELVLTVTSGMQSVVRGNRDLRVVKAPRELHPFHFPDGLASETEQRSASRVAARGHAINNCKSQWVTQWGRRFPSRSKGFYSVRPRT